MVAIVIAAAAVLLVIWGISVQNKLVKLDEYSGNALKQINVQQVSRYDAIKALAKLTREYSAYEGETLQKVVEARKITSPASPSAEDINRNESVLADMASKIVAVAERYPELKANQQYLKTMDEVTRYEENVRLSRMTFNDTVTKFNNAVRMFPGSVIASLLHFSTKEYLAEDKTRTDYPEI